MARHVTKTTGLFKGNGSIQEDPAKLLWANEKINTMMQQLDYRWNTHLQLEFFNVYVRSTLSQLGQTKSSLEEQELIQGGRDGRAV